VTQKKITPEPDVDNWKIRRRLVYISLSACGLFITMGALNTALDSSVANTLITQSFMVGGAVLMGYMGFATWEDKAKK